MPEINLIADRREERKKIERLAGNLFITLGASVGVLLLMGFYIGARQFAMSAEMASADQRMEKIQPTLDEIASIERSKIELLPKLETLQAAKNDTLRWRAVLQAVAECTPADTWLTELRSSDGPQPQITIQGLSARKDRISQMTLKMQANPLFQNVTLGATVTQNAPNQGQAASAPERIQEHFTITAVLTPVATSVPAPAKKTALAQPAGGVGRG